MKTYLLEIKGDISSRNGKQVITQLNTILNRHNITPDAPEEPGTRGLVVDIAHDIYLDIIRIPNIKSFFRIQPR